ncbi:flavin-containing monooxygenase [Hoyosella subflava]|uniref:FAD-dependent pyridine nucleotide-disulfide oxidoreductase n=1 Tax=Hoyosella subflava (strain DSM 45089 / JCM 17490 / NBRC 109087 / DQS3-9A1) TaxID=443218 RepID=F6EKA2_HOYSD|nr:NAD(P)/FAD-dependent oxidoreductase [Hoyosella subflava]AEF42643.1 FAD-dependent pyridine nucleotide-disulfide oxidoreductase [Hoyosella subflava DQS3-9A1]
MRREQPSVAIIGAGFGGLGMGIRLKQCGYTDVTVFEKADEVGGVWRENTYPGAACDVPSHLYSFSFEPKSDWSRRFAEQREILDYLKHCTAKYDMRQHIRFKTEVTSATFSASTGRWTLSLADGTHHSADILIPACGQLSRPAYPRLPGLDSFAGTVFHSAAWNHDYGLTDKRVAVVGTGASAIQFVPEIASKVKQLTLFQRSAPHVIPKTDFAYPRLAKSAFERIPGALRVSRWATYCELEPRALMFTRFPQIAGLYERKFLRNLRREITDPALREKLTPSDPIGCKRVLLSNDWYAALRRPNVRVETSPIATVLAHGIATARGGVHEADAIILGTGFQANDFLAPMRITGLEDKDLNEAWRDGAEAYLGITISGFPNLFLLYGPNTNLGHNSIILMLEAQINYTLDAIRHLRDAQLSWLDVKPATQNAFNKKVQERMESTIWDRECTSWYKNDAGKNTNNWPGFTFSYYAMTRKLDPADYYAEPMRASVS